MESELKRIQLDILDATRDTIQVLYNIGDIYFMVNLEYETTTLDRDTNIYNIELWATDGKWGKEYETIHEMQFTESYNQWMSKMIQWYIDEKEFLHEFIVNTDDNFNHWADYGI